MNEGFYHFFFRLACGMISIYIPGPGNPILVLETVVLALLENLGYRVLEAGNGREAVELYRKNRDRIRVMILDMVMPQMGGGETFDQLKAIDPGVKVLLSSGYSVNGQAQEILNRGCAGFIQKPFSHGELSMKLSEVLQGGEDHGSKAMG